MTRAQGPDSEIDYRSVGAVGAHRVVIVLRTGSLAVLDPAPGVTERYGVRAVLVHLGAPELDDPAAYGGETPAESTAMALAELATREHPDGPIAVVGERATTAIAFALAAELDERVDVVAVVAPPSPPTPLERDLAAELLTRVNADVLVVAAASEPATLEGARWYADAVSGSRMQELAAADVHSLDGRLGLGDAWEPVLAHLTGATS